MEVRGRERGEFEQARRGCRTLREDVCKLLEAPLSLLIDRFRAGAFLRGTCYHSAANSYWSVARVTVVPPGPRCGPWTLKVSVTSPAALSIYSRLLRDQGSRISALACTHLYTIHSIYQP